MKFLTLKEAEAHFYPYLPLSETDKAKEISYWDKYLEKPTMGEWLLFKHVMRDENSESISRPILGLVVGHTFWDMALVLEYVTEWRAWECNSKVLNTNVDSYYPIVDNDKTVKHIQFWTDNIIVIGHWEYKPKFKELRAAFSSYNQNNI